MPSKRRIAQLKVTRHVNNSAKKKKKKSKSKSEAAVKNSRQRRWHQWKKTFDCFDSFTEVLKSSTEQSRTFEENRLLIFAIKSYLKCELEKDTREGGDHKSTGL